MEIKNINIKYGLIFLAGFFIGRNYPDILNQAVNQAEHHSALITAIATVALVVATVLLANFNKKLWRAQNEPLLYFYKECFMHESGKLGISSQQMGFFVKNVGKGPAIKVKLNVRFGNPQEYSIETLSPGEKSQIFITPKIYFDREVTIHDITYNDLNGFKYRHEKVTLEPDEPLGLGKAIELIGDN